MVEKKTVLKVCIVKDENAQALVSGLVKNYCRPDHSEEAKQLDD